MTALADAPARKIEIHRAQNGKELMDVMFLGEMEPLQLQGLGRLVEADYAAGFVVKVLFSSEPLQLSLTYSWFKPGFPLPRHSHSADCLYYVISGEMQFGEEVLRAGDTMFVPAGSLYTFETGEGGVEFLEYRRAAVYDIKYQAPAKAWDRQVDQLKSRVPDWQGAEPPLAAKRMTGLA